MKLINSLNLRPGDFFTNKAIDGEALCVTRTCIAMHPDVEGPEANRYICISCTYPDGELELLYLRWDEDVWQIIPEVSIEDIQKAIQRTYGQDGFIAFVPPLETQIVDGVKALTWEKEIAPGKQEFTMRKTWL